jgi:hypothetical protein
MADSGTARGSIEWFSTDRMAVRRCAAHATQGVAAPRGRLGGPLRRPNGPRAPQPRPSKRFAAGRVRGVPGARKTRWPGRAWGAADHVQQGLQFPQKYNLYDSRPGALAPDTRRDGGLLQAELERLCDERGDRLSTSVSLYNKELR